MELTRVHSLLPLSSRLGKTIENLGDEKERKVNKKRRKLNAKRRIGKSLTTEKEKKEDNRREEKGRKCQEEKKELYKGCGWVTPIYYRPRKHKRKIEKKRETEKEDLRRTMKNKETIKKIEKRNNQVDDELNVYS